MWNPCREEHMWKMILNMFYKHNRKFKFKIRCYNQLVNQLTLTFCDWMNWFTCIFATLLHVHFSYILKNYIRHNTIIFKAGNFLRLFSQTLTSFIYLKTRRNWLWFENFESSLDEVGGHSQFIGHSQIDCDSQIWWFLYPALEYPS